MTPTTRRAFTFAAVLLLAMGAARAAEAPAGSPAAAPAGDWIAATDPSVVTNNDCGQIAALSGRPLIRRSFHTAENGGVPANMADRISSGDELVAPDGAHVEWTTGSNTVAVLGPGGRVRFDGLRTFVNAAGVETSRLDVTVLSGELRVQARLNENRPETVLASLGGAEFLIARGDVELYGGDGDDGWRCAAVSGGASGRIRRGAVPGAPFAVGAGTVVGASGESRLGRGEVDAIRARVPFSFETARAALPPMPMMSAEMDAP